MKNKEKSTNRKKGTIKRALIFIVQYVHCSRCLFFSDKNGTIKN